MADRAKMTKAEAREYIRQHTLDVMSGLLTEPPSGELDEVAGLLWQETVDAMGRRLAKIYGLDYRSGKKQEPADGR